MNPPLPFIKRNLKWTFLVLFGISFFPINAQYYDEREEEKKRILKELGERYNEVNPQDWLHDKLYNTVFFVRKGNFWGACVGTKEAISPQYSKLYLVSEPSEQTKGIFMLVLLKNNKYGFGCIQYNYKFYDYKEILQPVFNDMKVDDNHTGYFSNKPHALYLNLKSGNEWGIYLAYYRGEKKLENLVCEERIKPKYEAIKNNFYHGYSLVKQNGKWGLIGVSGKEYLIPKYDSITESTAICQEILAMQLNNKWGLFDLKTNKVITEPVYDGVSCQELNYVQFTKNGKSGIFNRINMKEVMLSGGPARIDYNLIEERKNGKWILYDKEGNRISPLVFDTMLHYNYRYVRVKANGKTGLADKNFGRMLFEPVYDTVENYYTLSSPVFWLKEKGKWGYADSSGKMVVKPKYSDKIFGCLIDEKARNYTLVKENNKWGLIDISGALIAPCKYDSIFTTRFNHPVAYTRLSGKTGLLDLLTGKEIVPTVYDDLKIGVYKKNMQYPYPIDYFIAVQKGKKIFLNPKGEIIPEPQE